MAKKTIKVRKWLVRVDQEFFNNPCDYTVFAVNELDARTIAFALDGGFPKAMTRMQEGGVALVSMYTVVLKST